MACQVGEGIGLGHLTRSLVAARALRDNLNSRVSLIVQGAEINTGLCADFDHSVLPITANLVEAISMRIKQLAIDVLLLDLFPQQLPPRLGEALSVWRSAGLKVVAVDGLLTLSDRLDMIFFPSFRCPSQDISASAAPVVYGWDCLLLNVDEKSPAGPNGNQVLVLTGGSDSTNLGESWPTILDRLLPENSEVHWVTGPFADSPVLPNNRRLEWQEHVAPQNLMHLMRRANFAVTLFGVSFFELLHYGVATVVFSPYGLKNRSDLDLIAASGVALVAIDERDATKKLVELMSNEKLAVQLSARSRSRLRVPGTKRLCSELEALISG